MVPAMTMQSDWRGENRITSMPKREMSKREPPDPINSIAQHDKPIGNGQTECLRTQLITASARETTTSPPPFAPRAAALTMKFTGARR